MTLIPPTIPPIDTTKHLKPRKPGSDLDTESIKSTFSEFYTADDAIRAAEDRLTLFKQQREAAKDPNILQEVCKKEGRILQKLGQAVGEINSYGGLGGYVKYVKNRWGEIMSPKKTSLDKTQDEAVSNPRTTP